MLKLKMKAIALLKFITLNLMLVSFYATCITIPPKIVFRVDLRPPEDTNHLAQDGVFTRGLTPWAIGDTANMNAADHVSGRSCTARNAVRNSGFISTTTDRNFAYEYIRSLLPTLRSGQSATLYTIRATPIFYEAYETLRYIHDSRLADVSANEFILSMAESEWLTPGAIPNNLIIRAEVFTPDGSRRMLENHNYVPIEENDVRANSAPYRSHQPLPNRSGWRIWVNDTIIPLISGCFQTQQPSTEVRTLLIPKEHNHEFSSYLIISLMK